MECKLVKLEKLSGLETSIYSVFIEEEGKTTFDKFIEENISEFPTEIKDIASRLLVIGNKTGAREAFFKLKEGAPGDGVCALYDNPNSNLRLYCIRYAKSLVVIGSGGPKVKTIRALQQDTKLTRENNLMKVLSKEITTKMKDQDLSLTSDYMDFEGDLTFKLEL